MSQKKRLFKLLCNNMTTHTFKCMPEPSSGKEPSKNHVLQYDSLFTKILLERVISVQVQIELREMMRHNGFYFP